MTPITDAAEIRWAADVVCWATHLDAGGSSEPANLGQRIQHGRHSAESSRLVMPPGFEFRCAPIGSPCGSRRDLETQRGAHYIEVLGRLKPGVPIDAARAEMRTIGSRLAQEYPRTNRDHSVSVHPLRESLVGSVRQSMFVLLGAVGLVLLIVCVNVASLVLIRGVGRGRDWP